jgi:hypothetical protein
MRASVGCLSRCKFRSRTSPLFLRARRRASSFPLACLAKRTATTKHGDARRGLCTSFWRNMMVTGDLESRMKCGQLELLEPPSPPPLAACVVDVLLGSFVVSTSSCFFSFYCTRTCSSSTRFTPDQPPALLPTSPPKSSRRFPHRSQTTHSHGLLRESSSQPGRKLPL